MRPVPRDDMVSTRLARQRRRDTGIEVRIRRRLHAHGFRFRLVAPVPGRPRRSIDLAFARERVAVLVDGCFWHACPLHRTSPRTNHDWWERKLATNAARDLDTRHALEEAGWAVIRVWEHEDPEAATDAIEALVLIRRASRCTVGRSI
ncbi:very short patch repair endonuclease [Curtobacterium sp. MCBD17_034]|uniref:very short patch repair endonuclease n=1 Tax=unclassified Curtobacterium TaxID=257496 RepID=UPI000DAA10BF|nr:MULTISPECIES: DNA mismatch endonuclease Vsr [unclassified Curtobacterium]PZF59354.1 very short patch repair endonuclease [Curtobacterium sp. MCBD17_034]PZM34378.1 very short patch repair endonuclease [Curtobacterium sp. MCBD17_031]